MRENPGMLISRSRAARKGSIAASMRSSRRAMSALWASTRSRNSRAMNAWCSPNRPVNASVRAGIFERILRLARSASVAGSRWPAISASSIARPETPVIWEATEDSLMPASSRSFSSRCTSRVRSRVITVRVRVRSRNARIGAGGTKDAFTNPWAPRSASHAASETSVLRPGRLRTAAALTRTTSKPSSSR